MDKLGPTGHRVGRRLRELRQQRGFTLGDLEAKLVEAGRPILLSALSKIEKGQRRVDVDDLVALALALDVSPNLLLLPDPSAPDTEVPLTESKGLTPATAWGWAVKDRPPPATARTIFISYAHRDSRWANWVAKCLTDAGYEVAIDSWDLPPGADLRAYLLDRINHAAGMVVIASENLMKSHWAAFELELARNRALPVLRIAVDNAALDDDILSDPVFLNVASEIEAKKTLLAAVGRLGIRSRPVEAPPAFPTVRPRWAVRTMPRQRTLVGCDIEGFTRRTSPALGTLRADMYDVLETALLRCDITEDVRDPFVDRGDGALVLLHPTDRVPKVLLLTTFVPALDAALAEHADRYPDRAFRLRVAIHAGEVHHDDRGVFGEDIDIVFRLLAAPQLKQRQQESGAHIVWAASDDIYRAVIRHGYDGIEPQAFTPFAIAVATHQHRGWLATAGSTPPVSSQPGSA